MPGRFRVELQEGGNEDENEEERVRRWSHVDPWTAITSPVRPRTSASLTEVMIRPQSPHLRLQAADDDAMLSRF